MINFKQGLIACAAVLVAGCSGKLEYGFALDSDHIVYRMDSGSKEDALAREEFYIDLASVVDRRRGEDRIVEPTAEGFIYKYDPNQFLQGLEVYTKNAYSNRLSRMSRGDMRLVTDMEIDRFDIQIARGGFFSGSYGIYELKMAYTVIVRDENSDVIFTDKIEYEDSINRAAYRGHHPSSKQDAKMIRHMLKEAISETATEIGWKIHRAFNDQRKFYKPHSFDQEFKSDAEDKDALPAS